MLCRQREEKWTNVIWQKTMPSSVTCVIGVLKLKRSIMSIQHNIRRSVSCWRVCMHVRGCVCLSVCLLVLSLRLLSLRFLSQYFRIIASYIYHDNSCACMTIYLHRTFALQARSVLLKFQHPLLHATAYRERRSVCDCVTLGEQHLHKIPPQLPLKSCRRWSGAILMTSQLPSCDSVVAFNLVYFV